MTGASKILTVSYGTFSCTLEGFDDPFSTMKAIAEYFRDLAADDRYFGAEPPTPDAAMLHKIAEREIQRRVEAKIQENGVVLRAAEGAGTAPTPTVTIPAVLPAKPVTPVLAEEVEDQPLPSLDLGPSVTEPGEAVVETESVAEKLSRLRAQAAEGPVPAAAVVTQDDGEATDALLADLMADFGGGTVAGPDQAVAEAEATEITDAPDHARLDEGADLALAEAEATGIADTLPPRAAPPPAEAHDDEDAGFDFDSLAAALGDEAPAPAPTAQAAVADAPLSAPDLTDAFVAEGETISLPQAAEEEQMPAPAEPAPDLMATADEAALQDALDPVESLFAPADEEPHPLPPEAAAPVSPALSFEDSLAAALRDEVIPAQAATEEPAAPDLRPEAAEKLQRARARVIRIRRGEAAAAPAPAPEATKPEPRPQPPVEAPILSPEAEADLEAELQALRAEMLGSAAPKAAAPVQPAAPAPEPAAPVAAPVAQSPSVPVTAGRRAFVEEAADAAVARLMAQADEVMDGPESKRRQSAIAHLKAAVAATVADRNAGAELPSAQPSRLARYRDDLAMVVRAKLGVGPAIAGERPAPLVLVSEQRIDKATPAPAPAAPLVAAVPSVAAQPAPAQPAAQPAEAAPGRVRPRRVVPAAPVAEVEEDEDETIDPALVDARGFADFADRLGARSLPELIEASAAYLAVVQKRDAFSRPQLMANVAAALPGDMPREDGLRSFGALLRAGRLSKLRRGQFALAPESSYLTEGKRIAG